MITPGLGVTAGCLPAVRRVLRFTLAKKIGVGSALPTPGWTLKSNSTMNLEFGRLAWSGISLN
jgi:hypothetical protein